MTDRKRPCLIDEAVAAARADEVPDAVVKEAGARVWPRVARRASPSAAGVPFGPGSDRGLGREPIEGCHDVLALLPEYREGLLEAARALLVEDHLHECARCRAAFQQPDRPRLAVLPWRPARPAAGRPAGDLRGYAVAAGVVLALGLAGLGVQRVFFGVPAGPRAEVQSVSGVLQRVAMGGTTSLAPGATVAEAETVRTGQGSQALLRLRDGSVVEVGERAEVSVTARGRDTTVHLERGHVIVQAARRRVGSLRVASRDCTVSVTGTVFSVSSGLKGSRVSVLEGEVRVRQGRREERLHPGDQMVTSPGMGTVPLREEIAWSRNLDAHLALLSELSRLRGDLRAVKLPGLRYESRLLPLVPADAVVFASVPNYGEALDQAHQVFEQRLAVSPVLRDWWREADPSRHGGPSLTEIVEKVRSFAGYLGDEVVFAALPDAKGGARPLLMAEVRQGGLREFLEGELQGAKGRGPGGPALRILGDQRTSGREKDALFVSVQGDLLAIGADAAAVRAAAARRQGGGGLDTTAFGRRIAESYAGGVNLLFAADLQGLRAAVHPVPPAAARPSAAAEALGLGDLRHLVIESKEVGGRALSEAVLTVAGPRRGVVSWLGAPAPMGSLEFVSPQATAAAAFVVKTPALLLDDLLAAAPADPPGRGLAEIESHLDVRLREDVAETLGGEVAFALDGPILPTPSWKAIVEVYDPVRLQGAFEALVQAWNREAARDRRPELRLEGEQVGSRTFHALRPVAPARGLPFEVHYAYVDGYLVAAPSRALVMRAIQVREGGESLARSERFQSLMPADGDANASAVVFQDFGSLLGLLADGAGAVGADQREALAGLARDVQPSLVCAYGGEDRIRLAGTGGLFSLEPATAALPALLGRLHPERPDAPIRR